MTLYLSWFFWVHRGFPFFFRHVGHHVGKQQEQRKEQKPPFFLVAIGKKKQQKWATSKVKKNMWGDLGGRVGRKCFELIMGFCKNRFLGQPHHDIQWLLWQSYSNIFCHKKVHLLFLVCTLNMLIILCSWKSTASENRDSTKQLEMKDFLSGTTWNQVNVRFLDVHPVSSRFVQTPKSCEVANSFHQDSKVRQVTRWLCINQSIRYE